jgi:succinate-acetate transporter protein
MSTVPSGQIVLRPIANPLPLGFLALVIATTVISAAQLHWLPATAQNQTALVLLAAVFPLQLLASVLGFLGRDVVAATGMGVLAGTWLAVGLVTLANPAAPTSPTLGVLLIASTAAMAVAAAGATGKLVAMAVLATTSVRFAATAGYELAGTTAWRVTAGVIGLLLAAVALYAAAAFLLEDAYGRAVLPLARRGDGPGAPAAGTGRPAPAGLAEAGVRKQL